MHQKTARMTALFTGAAGFLLAVACLSDSVNVTGKSQPDYSGLWRLLITSELLCSDSTCTSGLRLDCPLSVATGTPPACLTSCAISDDISLNVGSTARRRCYSIAFAQLGGTLTAVCGDDNDGECIYSASGTLTLDQEAFTGTLIITLGSADCATCTDTYTITGGKIYDEGGGPEFWGEYMRTSSGSNSACSSFTHLCSGPAAGYFVGTITP